MAPVDSLPLASVESFGSQDPGVERRKGTFNKAVLDEYKTKLRWSQALAQMEKEAQVCGKAPSTIGVTRSVCKSFLEDNGYELDEYIEAEFVDSLERAVQTGNLGQCPALKVSTSAADDSGFRSRIGDLIRACRVLATGHFTMTLRTLLASSPLSHREIAIAVGLKVPQIRGWLANNRPGVSNLSAEKAKKLDEVLRADGLLLATHVAVNQDVAYRNPLTIKDKILGKEPFSRKLRAHRLRLKRTMDSLLDHVETITSMRVTKSQFSKWEQGLYVPSEGMRPVIKAVDDLCGANGDLTQAWEAEGPRIVQPPYRLPCGDWPERISAQFERVRLYKTTNPEELPTSENKGSDRWTCEASANKFATSCAQFFGYLLQERAFAEEQLSITLFCDWPLVRGYFDFIAKRTGDGSVHSFYAYTLAGFLQNLYNYYFPALASTAAREPYWQNHLPMEEIVEVQSASGFVRKFPCPLNGDEERWRYQVHLAKTMVHKFMKSAKFESESLCEKAQELLDMEISLNELSKAAALRVRELPPRILCRKAAILSRRLAVVALIFARAFRPGTLDKIRTTQVAIGMDRKVSVSIDEAQFKNRGKGGSENGVKGPLADIDWIHEAIRRYVEEGRPLLLGDAKLRTGRDDGFFLTASLSKRAFRAGHCPGEQLTRGLLSHDVQAIAGYNPYAQRYLYASDAYAKGVSTDEIAHYLQNTPEVTDRVYKKRTAGRDARKANQSLEGLIKKHRGSSPPK